MTINRFTPGCCCDSECYATGFDNFGSTLFWGLPCCETANANDRDRLRSLPEDVIRQTLSTLDYLIISPISDLSRDSNGDGRITEDDWLLYTFENTNGSLGRQIDPVGDWIFDGGRAIVSSHQTQAIDVNFPREHRLNQGVIWATNELNQRIASLGSSIQVGEYNCYFQSQQLITDYNHSIGFDWENPAVYSRFHRHLTGGNWMFKAIATGEEGCGSASVIMAYEKIGEGLLVVSSVHRGYDAVSQSERESHCSLLESILETPIENL